MRKFITFMLIISILAAIPGELISKERRGAEVVIQKKDGIAVKGELIAVKKNALLVMSSESGADVSIIIEDIDSILTKKKIGKGFVFGSVIGSAWALAGSIGWDASLGDSLILISLFGSVGALVGGIVEYLTTHNKFKTIKIKGKSDVEIEEILEGLRKKAKLPDYS